MGEGEEERGEDQVRRGPKSLVLLSTRGEKWELGEEYVLRRVPPLSLLCVKTHPLTSLIKWPAQSRLHASPPVASE